MAAVVGKKNDILKPRFELLDGNALAMMAMALTIGAEKYGPDNWHHVSKSRYIGATGRHFAPMLADDDWDDDSGLPHAAHLMCNAMFLAAKALDAAEALTLWDVEDRWRENLKHAKKK